MKLSVTGNHAELRAEMAAARARLLAELGARDGRVRAQTLNLALAGLSATVYNTPAGAYERTGALLRGLRVDKLGSGSGTVYGVQVSNSAPYAAYVEYGSYGEALHPVQAQAVASTLGAEPRVLATGRSGLAWQTPSLAHVRAAAFWLAGMRQEFGAAAKKVFAARRLSGVRSGQDRG